MKRSGSVSAINHEQGMVAIATDDGHTIIEIDTSWKLDVGDLMSWDDGYHIGPAIYQNLSKGSRKGVFVKNHAVEERDVDLQLLR